MNLSNVSIQIIPSVPSSEVYPLVDKIIAFIHSKGYKYVVGPMETTIEGPLEEILAMVPLIHQMCEEEGAASSLSVIKIHYKKGGVTIDEKISQYKS